MVLHREQTLLQDYFPTGLIDLIQRATTITPKAIDNLLLTVRGQLFKRGKNGFELLYNGPIQDVVVGALGYYCITLDAKFIELSNTGELLKVFSLENVTTLTWSYHLVITTSDGSVFGEDGTVVGYSRLGGVKEPIVAVTSKVDLIRQELADFLLLTLDMKLLHYHVEDDETTVVPDIKDVASISPHILVRIDGRIYEDDDNEGLDYFVLNKNVSDVVSAFSNDGPEYAIINRTGELFYKSIDPPYKRVTTGGPIIAVAPGFSPIIIRADGRIVIYHDTKNPVTIPRFNVLNNV